MKFRKVLFLIIINLFIFSNVCSANFILSSDATSKEYEKWLIIPDVEKDEYIVPSIHTIDLEMENPNVSTSLFDITASANEKDILPLKYNIADSVDITVRDQGITNSCWAISTVEMFETNIAKMKKINKAITYSSRHVDYSSSKYFLNNVENIHGFNRKVGNGANYKVAFAYFTSGKGPILEEDMPFENNVDLIDISEIQNKPIHDQLRDYTAYPNIYKAYDEENNITYSNGNKLIYTEKQISEFRNIIKKQIMKFGAVGSYTYAPRTKNDYNYFSKDNGNFYGNSYFCNNTNLTMNHSICIVGWDDTYSKENFKEGCRPANDGAYIALNSWGTDWNDHNGYYYISYDDYFIELSMYGIQDISEKKYDNIYQYDEFGNNFALNSTVTPTYIYGANYFNKNTNNIEKLTDIGLYIYSDNTSVEIYLSNDKEINLSNLKFIGKKGNLTTGYHVISIEEDIYIDNNFTIIVKYSKEGIAQLPIEANYLSLGYSEMYSRYNSATANAGESFVSLNGNQWIDLTDKYPDANICIKAFTINITQDASNMDYVKNQNWKLIKGNNVTMLSGINEKTTVNDLISTDNFLSEYVVKAYKNNVEITSGYITTGTVIKVFKNDSLISELYIVIYGDTTGDGTIQASDALAIIKNNLNTATFSNEVYLEAGRVSKSKRANKTLPNAVDALACVKYKLGTGIIDQM